MKTRKTQKSHRFTGFGFPINLNDVPMVKVRGAWVPDVDFKRLESCMAIAVALKRGRITGNELRFLRLHLRLTLQDFARPLRVSHPAVMRWEAADDEPTRMAWGTETTIRLNTLIAKGLSDRLFAKAWQVIEARAERASSRHALNVPDLKSESRFLRDRLGEAA